MIAAAAGVPAGDPAPALSPPSPPPPSLASGVLGMALKLALVLLLAYAASLVLRRLAPPWRRRDCLRTAVPEPFGVLATLALGHSRTLYLLAVGSRRLLIGATPQQFALLGDLTAEMSQEGEVR